MGGGTFWGLGSLLTKAKVSIKTIYFTRMIDSNEKVNINFLNVLININLK